MERMRLSTGRHRYERGFYPGYSIFEGAGAAAGGGGHGALLLEGDEDAEEEWFGEYEGAGIDDSSRGGMPRYLRPPNAASSFCLAEGLPQDALVSLSALLSPAELMRLSLASKALAARVGRGPGGAYPWLQKCLQAWNLPEGTALAQFSPESRVLDFAALYPDIVAWPSDIETDARRPLRRSPSTLALIQGRGHSGAFKVVDFHTVQFAGEGLGLGNRAVRATVPFPSLEDPTNRLQGRGKKAADRGDADDNSMWHRLQRFTRGLQLHLPPPTPSTVVPLSLAASAAAAAAAGSLSATATAAALMSSGYYYSSAQAAAAAAVARGPNGSNSNNGHGVFPSSFFPSYFSASLASSGMAGSASALFSASAPASLAAFMAQHMPRVPTTPATTTASVPASPSPRPLSPLQQLEQAVEAEGEEDAKAEAAAPTPQGPQAFSAPWTRPDGALEVRPRLVAYYEVAILPREGSPVPSPAPAVAAAAPPVPFLPAVVEEDEDEPIFMVDDDEEEEQEAANELAVLLHQQQQQPQQEQQQVPPAGLPALVHQEQPPPQAQHQPGEGEGGNNCVAVGLAAEGFHLEGYMPGWDLNSYGFHSDDGGIFHGTGIKVRYYGPRFGAGDTVGCGLDYARKEIFFTLNGQYLGVAFDSVVPDTPLYPTVGIDSRHPVSLNFGEAPFAFNLDAYQGLRAAAEAEKDGEEAGAAGAAEATTTTHVAPLLHGVPVTVPAPVQLP